MTKNRISLAAAVLILLCSPGADAALLINEISTGGSEDWVELRLTGSGQSLDVSELLVTMYTGTNHRIASAPLTMRSEDDPSTSYDERFLVVRFTGSGGETETDSRGDANRNGIREAYCDNYGLWNTDCAVAVDTDDDPGNGGITDFAALSNRDGSMNSTIGGYITDAVNSGAWSGTASANMQDCCIYTGEDGLEAWASLSRKGSADTNTKEDFAVTPFSTPGRENIIDPARKGRKIFRPERKRIFHNYGNMPGNIELPLFIFQACSVKVRIFTSAGVPVYSSHLEKDIFPGAYRFRIEESSLKGRTLTGLYPVRVEAVAKGNGGSESSTLFLIIIRRKR